MTLHMTLMLMNMVRIMMNASAVRDDAHWKQVMAGLATRRGMIITPSIIMVLVVDATMRINVNASYYDADDAAEHDEDDDCHVGSSSSCCA